MREKEQDKSKSKSILLLHAYLVNNWKEISKELLDKAPHEDVAVHFSYDLRYIALLPFAYFFFKNYSPRIKWVFFTSNKTRHSEVMALEKFRRGINFEEYSIATYVHTKGVTKPENKNLKDIRELMEYFLLEKFEMTLDSFKKGFELYGVNLMKEGDDPKNINKYAFKFTKYIFRGNFVSINLDELRDKFLKTKIPKDYFGVEGFWGNLTNIEKAYCPHESGINHYEVPYPPDLYRKE